MKLRFTPRAVRDLVEIADFIHERSPQSAVRRLRSAFVRQSFDRSRGWFRFPTWDGDNNSTAYVNW